MKVQGAEVVVEPLYLVVAQAVSTSEEAFSVFPQAETTDRETTSSEASMGDKHLMEETKKSIQVKMIPWVLKGVNLILFGILGPKVIQCHKKKEKMS